MGRSLCATSSPDAQLDQVSIRTFSLGRRAAGSSGQPLAVAQSITASSTPTRVAVLPYGSVVSRRPWIMVIGTEPTGLPVRIHASLRLQATFVDTG